MALRQKKGQDGKQLTDKGGRLVWQADYYEGGQRRRPDIRGSKEYAQKTYAALLKKKSPAPTSFARVKNLVPGFFVWFSNEGSKNTMVDMINTFNSQLLPFFGDYAINQVDAGLIKQYKDKRSADKHQRKDAPVSRRTINKELSYFSSFLNFCEDELELYSFDFRVKRFKKVGRPVPVPFSMEEIVLLLAEIKPQYRLPFLLMSDMGLRKTEALELEAEHIQGDVIHVHGKGSKTRVIPIIGPRLKKELKKAIKQHPSGYLITNPRTGKPYDSMKKELFRILKAANLELQKAGKPLINKPIRHHLLRHSFGTNAIKSKKFSLAELKLFMGHTSINTTMLYVTLAGMDLTEAAKDFGDYTVTKK